MKPAPFDYRQARTVEEAIALLQPTDSRVLAGGQSLGPMLNLRAARPARLVDINRIAALRTIDTGADGALRLGACVTHAALEDRPTRTDLDRLLGHVARDIAFRAIRTRGTIAGSLAHADPAADWPVVLAALGASLTLHGPAGERRLAVADFIVGLFETRLAPAEIAVSVEIPAAAHLGWGFRKVARKAGEFAHALAACVHRGDTALEVWLGALGDRPRPFVVERAAVYASIHAALDVGDGYERHLHAHNAAEAVNDALLQR